MKEPEPFSWHTLRRAHLALLPIPLLVVEAQLRNGVCADDLRHVEPVLHRRHGDLHFICHVAFRLWWQVEGNSISAV